MASYISDYTGKQIDEVIKLFDGKSLIDVEGIVKKNSDGTYSAAVWNDIPNTPITLEGYGITDAVSAVNYDSTSGSEKFTKTINKVTSDIVTVADLKNALRITWLDVDSTKPTTLNGYGITDAYITNGVVTLGNNTIEPVPTSMIETVTTSSDSKISTSKAMKKYVDTAIGSALSSVYRYQGSVATYQDLPSEYIFVGDVYDVQDSGMNYAWNGTAWDALGQYVDLSVLATKSEVTTGLAGKQDTLISSTNIKTINSQSILGSGNLVIDESVEDVTVDGTSVVSNKIAQIDLSGKQDKLIGTHTAGQNIKTVNGISILGSGNIEVGGGGTTVQSDWVETDTSSAAYILNKPTLSTVATSGSYNDLTNKPTIPPQLTAGTGITIDSNNVISVNLVNAETQSF